MKSCLAHKKFKLKKMYAITTFGASDMNIARNNENTYSTLIQKHYLAITMHQGCFLRYNSYRKDTETGYRSKTTTQLQYETLAYLMTTKRDIAQGLTRRPKEEVQAFLEEVARALNALGPPSKDGNTWRKVWTDWKCYIKRKLSRKRIERMGTGGGPGRIQHITPLEETVIGLTGLETCTNGIRGAQDFGDSVEVQNDHTSDMEISASCGDVLDMPSTSRVTSQPRARGNERESASSFLTEQIELQKNLYADSKAHYEVVNKKSAEMVTYLRRMNRSLEVVADTVVRQYEEEKRHNRIKEELLKQKVEIKLQMLKLDRNYKSNTM
ncbi:uncharacterized protein [Eurosta solidaginis]|uniref:uncharacterized protein n=1 Tax=Eurosta solidaginis TaxID=178769 RepID=UPI003530CFB3